VTRVRAAARAVLIADGAVLLLHGRDSTLAEAPTWWFTPGGGIERGEAAAAAVVREVLEETGLALDEAQLGPVVAVRTAEFVFEGERYRQSESFFAIEVPRFEPTPVALEAVEARSILGARWWSRDELAVTRETVYPRELPQLLRTLDAGGASLTITLSGE
jgi:8-oxo-dGTP pyrophosphatase MutT (NUDIX family)